MRVGRMVRVKACLGVPLASQRPSSSPVVQHRDTGPSDYREASDYSVRHIRGLHLHLPNYRSQQEEAQDPGLGKPVARLTNSVPTGTRPA